MVFRVAGVSFLNTWPLVDPLHDRAAGEVELSLDLPSRLPPLLESGDADVALIPAIEYLRGVGDAIVPGIAIGSRGPVDSVKLFHDVPAEKIESVAVDRGSRTSVALMRLLLSRLHGADPELIPFEPGSDDPLGGRRAALVIGDRCFEIDKALRDSGRDDVRDLDLATGWRGMTGLPFVFAVWVVSRSFLATASPDRRDSLTALLRDSARKGMARSADLAARAFAAGHLGPKGEASVAAISSYFNKSLDYSLGSEQLAGLSRFRDLAVEAGICPQRREIELLPEP